MTDPHDQQWDGLALGHVLGGLDDTQATAFRGHLVGCATCRARVAELRDMAADLASADRDERAVQRLRTATRQDVEERELPPADPELPRWRTVVVVALALLVVTGLSLWNAHLRNQTTEYARVVEVQERALDVLGAGTSVPVEQADGVTGVVAVDGDRVAYTLAGIPALDVGERLVIWVDAGDGLLPVDVLVPTQVPDGHVAAVLTRPGARRLVLSVEPPQVPAEPGGPVLLTASLD